MIMFGATAIADFNNGIKNADQLCQESPTRKLNETHYNLPPQSHSTRPSNGSVANWGSLRTKSDSKRLRLALWQSLLDGVLELHRRPESLFQLVDDLSWKIVDGVLAQLVFDR